MVNPGAALKSTSSENGRSAAEKLLHVRRPGSSRPITRVQTGVRLAVSWPALALRASPRSTASATAMDCGSVKQTVAFQVHPAVTLPPALP